MSEIIPEDRNLTYRSDSLGQEFDDILKMPRDNWLVKGSHIRSMWKDRIERGINLTEQFPDLFSNLDYDTAIATAVVKFNNNPPMARFSPTIFPDTYWLRTQAFIEILRIAEAYHASNYFTGSSAGISIPVHERFDAIRPLLLRLEQENDKILERHKRRQAMIEAMGSSNHYEAWGYYGRRIGP